MSIAGDLIRGHTDTIILARLMLRDSYGYEINKTVTQLSGGKLELKEATLYTAFRRLEEAGMAVHPDTRRMMDALQRRDLAEIFSQIGNVFVQVRAPESEFFGIRDRLLTLGAGPPCMSGSGSAGVVCL